MDMVSKVNLMSIKSFICIVPKLGISLKVAEFAVALQLAVFQLKAADAENYT